MSVAESVIGVISGVLGIYQFLADTFPATSDNLATVRVHAALNGATGPDGGTLDAADGNIADVRLYNEHEELLGAAKEFDIYTDIHINSGEYYDFTVDQSSSQQAPYVYIVGANDGICIAYTTVTWTNGYQYGWVGDWGMQCGLDWYYSDVYVDQSDNKPMCTWIDGDHTNGAIAGVLEMHMPTFTSDDTSADPNSFCGGTTFRSWANDGGDQILKKRSLQPRNQTQTLKAPARADSRLVVSNAAAHLHNATALCESPSSRGPDFVSRAEGVYCNMETRETLPLCAADGVTTTECFDVDAKHNVKRDGSTTRKSFSDVMEWS
ncbi:hypothetical protein GGR56DRAFT_634961 [Xylariaceae sp. FL0804]|nr:hypothetical protein GGR56DRAFT_634961 [Xylariaceae sp. FL0804]